MAYATKNSVNAVIGCVGMLLSHRPLISLNSIGSIQHGVMCVSFNGNPKTTILLCYNSSNASDETDIIPYFNELSSLTRHISKPNFLTIGGDVYIHIGKNRNKFCQHSLQKW